MNLPLFAPGEDPGPDFSALLRRRGGGNGGAGHGGGHGGGGAGASTPLAEAEPAWGVDRGTGAREMRHATTVVALRYADGVAMAGDRRATEGHTIAHRSMDKVFPADRYSAISIAGAAGPAMEMVRIFQTQLEHYEKVEGLALSLEGKANQLAQMVRAHLPMAMQGLVVVPLFAGYDTRRRIGRIFTYDVAGGRYEEADHHATGSGGRDARTTIKLGWTEAMERDRAIELAVEGLYEAADEDSATGGPDVVRGIYPTVATVTAEGFIQASEAEVAERFGALIERKTAEGRRP